MISISPSDTRNKRCPACKVTKPSGEFYRDRVKRDGLATECKPCQKKYHAGWRSRNAAKMQAYELGRKFGISEEQYQEMFRRQGGKCWICKRPPGKRRLAVDHCHKSGRIRGLLCPPCNAALGAFNDDASLIRAAIAYLEST